MIACFSSGSGLDGRGSKCSRARPVGIGSSLYLITPTADEEEQVYNQLANLRDSLPIRLRDRVEEVLLGAGANGIAFIDNRRVSVAFEGDVAVYFQGHLTKLDAGAESPAHDILRKYTSGQWAPDASDVNYGGGSLAGEFAFVLFDKLSGRVVAARDQSGTEPLFWGTSAFGEMLLFANDRKMLEVDCSDVDAFPAGTLFFSKCGEITGELNMLSSVDDVEEEEEEEDDEEEQEEAINFLQHVWKSEKSLQNLHRIGSQNDVIPSAA